MAPSSTVPLLLARGPWAIEDVLTCWHRDAFEPTDARTAAADAAITALRERGSPAHDGVAARLVAHREESGPPARVVLELQPLRWALRLVEDDACGSLSALCAVRDAGGRWLAGRRAPWLSTWAGRWALGAGGAVDVGESPADALVRELREEWSVEPERVRGEALVQLPHGMVMFIGQAWLPEGAEVVPDHEHDAFAWWPPDPADWPPEADEPLRRMAELLDA